MVSHDIADLNRRIEVRSRRNRVARALRGWFFRLQDATVISGQILVEMFEGVVAAVFIAFAAVTIVVGIFHYFHPHTR